MEKTITIFGSSLPAEGNKEYEDAYKLGSLLAKNGFNVCTGGYQGIMDAASKGASENGAGAIGVTVNNWCSAQSEHLTKVINCSSLFERIEKLVDIGDGFVILQGGTGTMLELAVVWELMNKKIIETKPTVCHSQLWQNIIAEMEKQILKEERMTGLIKCFDTVEDIVNYFKKNLLV